MLPALGQPFFTVITRRKSDCSSVVEICKGIQYTVSLVKPDDVEDDVPKDTNYLRLHILASVLEHLMRECGYRAFALEDQMHGVLAKNHDQSQGYEESQLMDVVALRNCVMNDRSKSIVSVCYV